MLSELLEAKQEGRAGKRQHEAAIKLLEQTVDKLGNARLARIDRQFDWLVFVEADVLLLFQLWRRLVVIIIVFFFIYFR